MAIIIKKFGGTSLSDLDHIKNAALRVKEAVEAGSRPVVVVSAMGGVTGQLLGNLKHRNLGADPAESDVVLSAGEQVSAGTFALALRGMGLKARSFMGWQVPIITSDKAGKAQIREIPPETLKKSIKYGEIPVIAGFQGVTEAGRITTLGRGGSDITAVALAAALKAERCDIYTDVPGIYTTDPNLVSTAYKLDTISYQEVLELAAVGARVMHSRAVALALRFGVTIQVLTSYENRPGTLIVKEKDLTERRIISGIACSDNEAKISIIGIRDEPGTVAAIFKPLAEAGISVDMIVQDVSKDGGLTDVTFTVDKDLLDQTLELIKGSREKTGFKNLISDRNVIKLTVVGLGMAGQAGVAQTMFTALGERGINIQAISATDIKISVLVQEKHQKEALQSLHAAYGLDKR
ncbi:MAG: aspartate kinase [Proteobacteria bacterium]|nr:aspartate kinase [Pseudomonadota bacterium]